MYHIERCRNSHIERYRKYHFRHNSKKGGLMNDIQKAIEELQGAHRKWADVVQAKDEHLAAIEVQFAAIIKEYKRFDEKRLEAEAMHQPDIDRAKETLVRARETVKQKVLDHGRTVEHNGVKAVWTKGKPSWDTESLKQYAEEQGVKDQFYVTTPVVQIRGL
jgi:hypothetical protein